MRKGALPEPNQAGTLISEFSFQECEGQISVIEATQSLALCHGNWSRVRYPGEDELEDERLTLGDWQGQKEDPQSLDAPLDD